MQVAPEAIRLRARLPGRLTLRRPRPLPPLPQGGEGGLRADVGPPRALARGRPKSESPATDDAPRRVVVDKPLRRLARVRAVSGGLSRPYRAAAKALRPRPQVRRDYPLSLSISISGGKETYKDSPSNGERTGKRPA